MRLARRRLALCLVLLLGLSPADAAAPAIKNAHYEGTVARRAAGAARVAGARQEVRWLRLAAGIGGMVAVANLQCACALFVEPAHERHCWGRVAIQFAVTLCVLTETWLVPVEGYLVDRFG